MGIDGVVPRRVWLYRLFDVEGSLLYVGVSLDPARRVLVHRRRIPWHHYLAEPFPDQRSAAVAEGLAIIREGPRFNVIRGQHGNLTDHYDRRQIAEDARALIDRGEATWREAFAVLRGLGVSAYRAAHLLGLENTTRDPYRRVLGVAALLALNEVS